MAPQNPPTGADEAVLQGNPVSNIPADRAEGMLSLLKLTPYGQQSSMGDLIGSHHQTRLANAQMYSNAAKTALHAQLMIQHGIDPDTGTRFDDPSYKGPSADDQTARYKANYDEAWTNYKKIAGVDQNTKGALAKAEQILNHILGGGAMQSAPGAPSDQGRRPGGFPPPPQAAAPSGGGGSPQTTTSVQITPPPSPQVQPDENFALAAPMIEANTQFEQAQGRGLETEHRRFQQDIQQRKDVAENILKLDPKSREYDYYVATGHLPPVFRLQKTPYIDPNDFQAKFGWGDPASGGPIADELGNPVMGAIPIAAGTQPKQFSWLGPHGEKFPGIQVGTKFYGRTEQGLQELSPSTQIWFAGATPRTTTTVRDAIDQITGETQQLKTSRTTAPSFMPQATEQAVPAAPAATGAIPPPPTPLGTPPVGPAPKGSGGGKGVGSTQTTAPSGNFPPGAKNEKDARRIAAHQYAQNVKSITTTTRTMVETAPKVKQLLTAAEDKIDGLKDELGPGAGRWNDFWVHKVGVENPAYMRFRSDTDLAYSLLMRMHRGSQGSDAATEHFKQIIAASYQSPENMKATIDEIKAYADHVIDEGKQMGLDLKSAQTRAAEATKGTYGATTPPTPSGTAPIKNANDLLSKYGIAKPK